MAKTNPYFISSAKLKDMDEKRKAEKRLMRYLSNDKFDDRTIHLAAYLKKPLPAPHNPPRHFFCETRCVDLVREVSSGKKEAGAKQH